MFVPWFLNVSLFQSRGWWGVYIILQLSNFTISVMHTVLHNNLQLHLIFIEVYKISSIQNKHEKIHVICLICALESQILVFYHFINPSP